MPRLVAVEAIGSAFVEALQQVWDAGDAVAPVDPRWPAPARGRIEAALRVGDDVEAGDAIVIATSGSSGEPKGVVLTHDAIAASAQATSARLAVDPAADRWLACLPLAHIGGLSVVARALVTGTPLTVHDAFDAAAVGGAAADGCTLTSLVPTMLRRVDVSPFRRVLLGGAAPLGPRPANVVATYGLTETGSGVVYDGVPLDGVDVRIAPPAFSEGLTASEPVKASENGEIHVRGAMLLRCYRGGTDPKDADGWFATGDAGSLSADGVLSVAGRIGDVINTGGEKVWPDAVEAVLRNTPGVADVGVAKRADPEWGERVVAFVVPSDRAAPPTLATLRARVREQLPAYAAPKEIVLIESLPRTASGKLRRVDLV